MTEGDGAAAVGWMKGSSRLSLIGRDERRISCWNDVVLVSFSSSIFLLDSTSWPRVQCGSVPSDKQSHLLPSLKVLLTTTLSSSSSLPPPR